MARAFIKLGDSTSHGGTVTEVSTTMRSEDGRGYARVGDAVSCPIHGSTTITTGDPTFILDDRPIARDGDETDCGATLQASQCFTTVSSESPSVAYAPSSSASRLGALKSDTSDFGSGSMMDVSSVYAQSLNTGTTAEKNLNEKTKRIVAVAEIRNELSGAQWAARFPGSTSTSDLTSAFGSAADNFIAALRQAGATVIISATLRPVERAYLMHWSWKIVHGTAPSSVPTRDGVAIEWVHPTNSASIQAAQDMVNAYGMANLGVAPSLNSRHTQGNAIDMTISWSGNLSIVNANGTTAAITSTPRTGMNSNLHTVGATYGVIKYQGSGIDRPHWSNDGR